MGESFTTDQTPVGTLPLELGQTMHLLYDFGDEWEFTITLERVAAGHENQGAPNHGKPRQGAETVSAVGLLIFALGGEHTDKYSGSFHEVAPLRLNSSLAHRHDGRVNE